MRLDKNRPYSEICGGPCKLMEQDGHYFNPGGREVDVEGRPVTTAEEEAEVAISEREVAAIEAKTEQSYEGMNWKHLKVLCENYGHEYTTKDEAIGFLRGKTR